MARHGMSALPCNYLSLLRGSTSLDNWRSRTTLTGASSLSTLAVSTADRGKQRLKRISPTSSPRYWAGEFLYALHHRPPWLLSVTESVCAPASTKQAADGMANTATIRIVNGVPATFAGSKTGRDDAPFVFVKVGDEERRMRWAEWDALPPWTGPLPGRTARD